MRFLKSLTFILFLFTTSISYAQESETHLIEFNKCNFLDDCSAFRGQATPCYSELIISTHGSPNAWVNPNSTDDDTYLKVEAYLAPQTEYGYPVLDENGEQVIYHNTEGFAITYDFKAGYDYDITIIAVQPFGFGAGKFIAAVGYDLPNTGYSGCGLENRKDFDQEEYQHRVLGSGSMTNNNATFRFSFTDEENDYNSIWLRSEAITEGVENMTAVAFWSIEIKKSGQPTLPPNSASNLNLNTPFANQITLNWSDNSDNEDGFFIQRRVQGGNWSTISDLGTNQVSFVDNTVLPGTTYDYRIISYGIGGESGPSNISTITTPSILNWVQTPNGGEQVQRFKNLTVHWDANLVNASEVQISIFDNWAFKQTFRTNTPNDGSENIWIPDGFSLSNNYRIRISVSGNLNIKDFSNQEFSIIENQDVNNWLLAPGLSEYSMQESFLPITWRQRTLANYGDKVILELKQNGVTKKTQMTSNDGVESIYIDPSLIEIWRELYIVIRDPNSTSDFDQQKLANYIVPFVDYSDWILAPNGGEYIGHGTTFSVSFTKPYLYSENITIDLLKGGQFYMNIASLNISANPINGKFHWSVPTSVLTGDDYQIKVGYDNFYDISDGTFSVTDYFVKSYLNWLTYPNGNEVFSRGSIETITWNTGYEGWNQVYFQFWKDETLVYDLSAEPTANDGSHTITIPSWLYEGTGYRLKIVNANDVSKFDWSDGYFTVALPGGRVTEAINTSGLNVFPTINEGNVTVATGHEEGTLTIISATGVALDSLPFNKNSTMVISLTDYGKGIYLLQYSTKSGTETRKVVFN